MSGFALLNDETKPLATNEGYEGMRIDTLYKKLHYRKYVKDTMY